MELGKKARVPDSYCTCGQLLSGASGMGVDVAPDPGDLSVCMYCAHLWIYDKKLLLRDLTTVELDAVMRDPEYNALIWKAREAVRALHPEG